MSNEEERELPKFYEMDTASLYARSGFRGGDIFQLDFPFLNSAESRELLTEVVQRHVLPKLDQRVQILIIPTVHNPVRVTSVDGVSVTWTAEWGSGPQLTPEYIRVSSEDVVACLKRKGLAKAVPNA